MWQSGKPSDDLRHLHYGKAPFATSNKLVSLHKRACFQLVVKSVSRHLISLGDLHRYRAFVEGSDDYAPARAFVLLF